MKAQTANLQALISKALQSMKIYTDFGGDSLNINVFATIFKWPDVTLGIIDIMDGIDGAEERVIEDINRIMLNPLMALSLALLESTKNIDQAKREWFERAINLQVDFKNVKESVGKRNSLVDIISKLSDLREESNEDRDSGTGQQKIGV